MQMISNCSCGMKNVKWFWMFSLNTLNLWNYSIFVGKFETFDLITKMIKIMCVFLFIDVQPYHHCTFLNKINFFQISKTFCQIKILSCNIVAALHSFFHLCFFPSRPKYLSLKLETKYILTLDFLNSKLFWAHQLLYKLVWGNHLVNKIRTVD